jgi:hypothetical protein
MAGTFPDLSPADEATRGVSANDKANAVGDGGWEDSVLTFRVGAESETGSKSEDLGEIFECESRGERWILDSLFCTFVVGLY